MNPGMTFSVYIVTALLVLYSILISLNAPVQVTGFLFFISPFLLIWMVITILKSNTHNEKDLAEDEEWGYADKKKEGHGTF
jgi:membrane protein implicated in regulation of membrane protease activity